MKAIKITIEGAAFLLPETHQFYEFPSYIEKHKTAIIEHVIAGRKFSSDPLADHFHSLPDLSEFKRITGIIGFPFDMRDADLYALDKNIEVIMELEL